MITCGWIEAVLQYKTTDIELMDDRESYRAQLRSALEKEKAKLLARVNCMEDKQ